MIPRGETSLRRHPETTAGLTERSSMTVWILESPGSPEIVNAPV